MGELVFWGIDWAYQILPHRVLLISSTYVKIDFFLRVSLKEGVLRMDKIP